MFDLNYYTLCWDEVLFVLPFLTSNKLFFHPDFFIYIKQIYKRKNLLYNYKHILPPFHVRVVFSCVLPFFYIKHISSSNDEEKHKIIILKGKFYFTTRIKLKRREYVFFFVICHEKFANPSLKLLLLAHTRENNTNMNPNLWKLVCRWGMYWAYAGYRPINIVRV